MPIATELLIADITKLAGFYVHPQLIGLNGNPALNSPLDLAPFGYPGEYIVESKVILLKSRIIRLYMNTRQGVLEHALQTSTNPPAVTIHDSVE